MLGLRRDQCDLRHLEADGLLLLAAVIWGVGFVAQRLGNEHVGPMTFTAVRFGIGAGAIVVVMALQRRRRGWRARPAQRDWVWLTGGVVAGVILAGASFLQQLGLVTTSAGKAAFITGLYVIFVAMLSVMAGHRVSVWHWIGAALGFVGLVLLSASEFVFDVARSIIAPGERVEGAGSAGGVMWGDVFVLGAAVVYAVYVQVIGWMAPRVEAFRLALTQFVTVAAVCLPFALMSEPITLGAVAMIRWPLAYAGVLSVGVAFTVQVMGQRTAPPTHSAIVMSLEAVFAAFAGFLLLGEHLTPVEMVGCSVMFAGMLVSQVRLGAK